MTVCKHLNAYPVGLPWTENRFGQLTTWQEYYCPDCGLRFRRQVA